MYLSKHISKLFNVGFPPWLVTSRYNKRGALFIFQKETYKRIVDIELRVEEYIRQRAMNSTMTREKSMKRTCELYHLMSASVDRQPKYHLGAC
jgi:hypothetical protein